MTARRGRTVAVREVTNRDPEVSIVVTMIDMAFMARGHDPFADARVVALALTEAQASAWPELIGLSCDEKTRQRVIAAYWARAALQSLDDSDPSPRRLAS